MSRNGMFHGLNRDARIHKLFDVARTYLLAGDHDPKYPYEVCTAMPPTPPSDKKVWEPAQARSSRRERVPTGSLTCTLPWEPDRGEVVVPARYWRRSGQWFRPRSQGEFGGGFVGFSYSECQSMDFICIAERLVRGNFDVCRCACNPNQQP